MASALSFAPRHIATTPIAKHADSAQSATAKRLSDFLHMARRKRRPAQSQQLEASTSNIPRSMPGMIEALPLQSENRQTKMHRDLTDRELQSLQDFAKAHGRSWKDKLAMVYWYNARVWDGRNELHSLRNEFGPEWLYRFKLPKVEPPRNEYNPDAINAAIAASNRAGRHIGAAEARAIHALMKGRT
jgi:hypothetical protein